ncbi:MAG: pyridoxal phosphate-dependent aminotransferase [Bryobacteraceae bacterium]
MFSSRLQWDLRPNPLSLLVEEKRRARMQVLDLTESNPTSAGLTYPGDEILAALADPRSLLYRPAPRGLDSAREAVSQYYAERGASVPPDRILITASTSEAYAFLFKLLADPGDEILTPRPSYPLFEFLANLESVRVRQYPLRYDEAWHVDLDALANSISPRTRAIVVVNLNNPTGSFLKHDEFERIEALAAPRQIAILSDEVFADYAFAPDSTRVSSLTAAQAALSFSMSGLSKIAGLPQMKIGWIVASGPGHEAALQRLELIADTYLSVAAPAQLALPRWLDVSAQVRRQIQDRTKCNLAHLRHSIDANSACRVLQVEGGWYATIRVPRTRTEEEWALALLAEHDVLVQPGFFFDFEEEAFLVVSLLTPPGIFAEGVRRFQSSQNEMR